MKTEQLEIEKLRREVAKLDAERDILKKPRWVSTGQRNGFGQRGDGELLAQNRAHRPQGLSNPRLGQGRCVRLHRALLQPETTTLDDRLPQPRGVRKGRYVSLTACPRNRQQLKGLASISSDVSLILAHLSSFRLIMPYSVGHHSSGRRPSA